MNLLFTGRIIISNSTFNDHVINQTIKSGFMQFDMLRPFDVLMLFRDKA